ncbi:hypothetical protein [Deminuibacter soli]|uniref:Uncharacterized protein n=1 Tax=Deminuibacter soli TaxID=2291815 RepID=A0A3E1NH18_9BACT|nr:hypothetical protein [Deminuibacter soli]RFM27239.1 hypothetical protein DXN05_14485 [Deminuibacter soli]
MFNYSVINVITGLVFIFLLYSLFVTALQEGLAGLFQRRSRVLYKGIRSMLSNTQPKGRFAQLREYLVCRITDLYTWLLGWFVKRAPRTLYGRFYAHPIIKNYGENALFSKPSYLSAKNFSTVLIDTLKNLDPENELKKADFMMVQNAINTYSKAPAAQPGTQPQQPVIDADTFKILNYHLNESEGSLDLFAQHLEQWFNDSMDRVSGWYKRTTHFWLFGIGLLLAITLNIDSISISTCLSKNKDKSDQLAAIGAAAATNPSYNPANDSSLASQAFTQLNADRDSITTLLGLGWKDYGKTDTTFIRLLQKRHLAFLQQVPLTNNIPDSIFNQHGFYIKSSYIASHITWTSFFGFFITAIAISLGAPFWFDLLNKFVNLRSSGKAIDPSGSSTRNGVAGNN